MDIQVSFNYAMALTLDDYRNNQKYILPYYESSYWLATGTSNYMSIFAVRDTGDIEPVNGLYNIAVRPCLHASDKDRSILNQYIGKHCSINEENTYLYTILTNGLVIADFSICQLPFIDVDTSVREANYYDKSLLKHNIDNWFNSHIDDIVTLHIID